MEGVVKTKPYCTPEVIASKNKTDKKRGKNLSPRCTKVSRLVPNPKVQGLKPITTSRVGAVKWKVKSPTLG